MPISNSGAEGGLRVAAKVSSKRNQYPLTFSHTNDYDERNEIYNRIFKFCCTDLSVSVWLYYIDGNDIIECGRLESAARLGSDSNPVPQTNLGLSNLYSFYCRIVPMGCWELPLVRFLHIYFGEF